MEKLADISAFERLQNSVSVVSDMSVFNVFALNDPILKRIFEFLRAKKEKQYVDKKWEAEDIAEEAGRLLGLGLSIKENDFKGKSYAEIYKTVKYAADDVMHGLYESGLLDHDDGALLKNGVLQRIIRRVTLERIGEEQEYKSKVIGQKG